MAHWHANLSDFTLRQQMIGVVAGLRRQIESDRKAGLALSKIAPVELIGLGGCRVARIGADQPRRLFGLCGLLTFFVLVAHTRKTRRAIISSCNAA